jgi:hypothetical protein
MLIAGWIFEDRLDGASNLVPWKVRVTLVLIENTLWGFSNTKVTPPMDLKDLGTHEWKDVKYRRIILDVVKDHFIPHISKNKSARDMFVALKNLFQSSNTNRKMVLRENIKDTKITKLDIVKVLTRT